jgi:hypothetical protein
VQQVPEAVVEALARLHALDDGLGERALARMIWPTGDERMDDTTRTRLWPHQPMPGPGARPWGASHHPAQRSQARRPGVTRSEPGWTQSRMRHGMQGARPPVDRGRRRLAVAHLAGLADKSRAPQTPPRPVWRPLLSASAPLHKRPPEAGACRLWRLRAHDALAVRTVGRGMALTKQGEDELPHSVGTSAPPPGPPPYTATSAHAYWLIDGRRRACTVDGVQWGRRMRLDSSARTIVAGARAPPEASWAALRVLATPCRRYGAPQPWLAESGGASLSPECAAVCARVEMDHTTLVRTPGDSARPWMETQVQRPRRLCDAQCSWSTSPAALAQPPHAFLQTSTTTAQQGLRTDGCDPPLPIEVLAEAQGCIDRQDGLGPTFSRALLPRTTHGDGCVTWQSSHCYVAQGLPTTKVLRWGYGEQRRAMFENVVLAEYHGR